MNISSNCRHLMYLVLFASLIPAKAFAVTDFRLGFGIPVTTVLGSNSSYFSYSPGLEFVMDIQSERESSYFLNVSYLPLSGKAQAISEGSSISLRPDVTDWALSGGAAYYPLRRKEGVTPVLGVETGFHFVTEEIHQIDALVNRETVFTNSLLFQNLSLVIGAEFQLDKRLCLQTKARVNINIPISSARNASLVYSNSQFNFMQLQFLVCAEYRLSK